MADACRFVCDFEGCRSQESHQREKQLLQCHFAVSEPTNSSLFPVWYRIDAPEEIRTPDPQIRSLTLDILADAQRFMPIRYVTAPALSASDMSMSSVG
jgi:hypothetical protein